MKKKTLCVFFILGMAMLLAGGSPLSVMAEDLKPTTMTWVAGGVGGGWYAQAGGLARLITEKEPKIILKVVPGGGVVNPVRISRGKDGLAWGVTFVDKMAFKGMAPVYKSPNPKLALYTFLYSIFYLMGLFVSLLLDHYVLFWLERFI